MTHFLSRLVESGKFPNGRLKDLMGGAPPTEVELLRIALLCGVSEEFVLPCKFVNSEVKP